MTTEAEIAAGRELYYGLTRLLTAWEDLEENERKQWVKTAMLAVRAYQRAAWREPTAEDLRERKPMLVTNQYMRGGDEWSPWRESSVSEWYMLSDQFDRIRIQDLPPLPEPMETTDE